MPKTSLTRGRTPESSWALSSRARGARIGALLFLVGSALIPNAIRLTEIWNVHPTQHDEMTQRERRFDGLRMSLPKAGVAGYVSDAKTETDLMMRLMLAEFSLAPAVLVRSMDQELVVGDFADGGMDKESRYPQLKVLRDFGGGVVLFTQAKR